MLKRVQPHFEVGNQEYRNYLQPANQDVFQIFNDRLSKIDKDWYKKDILDFGCNVGHLLTTSDGLIDLNKYTGIDILQQSLDVAASLHPEATWVHYNDYNSTFNPNGIKDAEIPLSKKFDYIIAYGVFTHCEIHEIKRLINKLKLLLNDGGCLVFSIWESNHYLGYLNFLKNCFNIQLISNENFLNINQKKSIYLVDRKTVVVDIENSQVENCTWLETFYNRDYFINEVPGSTFLDGIYSHHSIFLIKHE